jgi:hypothetical protein
MIWQTLINKCIDEFDNDMYMDNINIQMQDNSGRNTSVSSDGDDKKK